MRKNEHLLTEQLPQTNITYCFESEKDAHVLSMNKKVGIQARIMAMAVDLNAIKARLYSIPHDCDYHRAVVINLIRIDLPDMIEELEEHRASLQAKQETINMSEPRKHLP